MEEGFQYVVIDENGKTFIFDPANKEEPWFAFRGVEKKQKGTKMPVGRKRPIPSRTYVNKTRGVRFSKLEKKIEKKLDKQSRRGLQKLLRIA